MSLAFRIFIGSLLLTCIHCIIHLFASLHFRLLDDNCTVLRCLGRALPFELAIGVNGRVWVHSAGVTQTIVIANAILNSHQMPPHLVEMMVNKLVQRVSA